MQFINIMPKSFISTSKKLYARQRHLFLTFETVVWWNIFPASNPGCTKGDHCRGNYVDGVGLPDKNYHGRGYIQLTWGANYKLASEGLGLGDRLLKNPDLIANDTKLSMLVSVWYWEVRVRPLLKDKEDWFGLTTKGINPAECRIPAIARLRYGIYLRVAEALEISSKAKENGCYNWGMFHRVRILRVILWGFYWF